MLVVYFTQIKKKNLKVKYMFFFLFLIFFFLIQGLSFGTVDKILLKFPYKWWPDGFTAYSVLKTNETAQCTVEVRSETFLQQVYLMSVN